MRVDESPLGTTRVLWPNGQCIAVVQVSPDSSLPHVLGTFEEGPGFGRLRPMLDEFHTLYSKGDLEAAYTVSSQMDELGITAIDERGRTYDVFNINFDGLLFGANPTKRAPSGSAPFR